MKNRIFLTIVFVFISTIVFSQSSPSLNVIVKGQMMDSLTNETIPYATLGVVDKSNPTAVVKALATDENGKFQFSMNKAGEYVLTVKYIGKIAVTKDLVIGSEKIIDLGRINMPDDATNLSEVVVTADKPLVKVDLDKITYSMEDDPEAKTNNVLEMLRKVPLITVDGEDNIQLKGSSSFRIFLNGKPSNMITNNPKDVLRSMPANTIKDIQVITDPGAKYDAEGIAGIINIITKKQSSLGGYTANLNSRADTFGGYGLGAYFSLKYGKIGFTGNYNYSEYIQPKGDFSSVREIYQNTTNRYLYQNGTTKSNNAGQFGSGELSYEIDTLNLINVGYNTYQGNSKSTMDWIIESQNDNRDTEYKYTRKTRGKGVYGGGDLNVDYQRTFKKKDQLLTASYRLSHSPNDSKSDNGIADIEGVLPPLAITNRQFSDASMNDHAFQIDFATPFGKVQNLEVGAKYTIRLNESTSGLDTLGISGIWGPQESINDRFKHQQDILASYGAYSVKLKKWGMKAGLRYEATSLKADFPLAIEQKHFEVDYSNLVPSTSITYQIKPTQTIRFGYNMRILRPNIWQLNPNKDSSDPNFVRRGNSELDAVQSNSITMNYSFFNPKLNFNLNADYNFEDNGVEAITTVDGTGVSFTTYENIATRKNVNLSAYINWSPTQKLRIYSNLRGGYMDIKANNNTGLANSGFTEVLYGGAQYQFPKSWRIGVNAGYFGPNITLQGETPSVFFHSVNIGKSFMKERLTFRVYASEPFRKKVDFVNRESTATFSSESIQSSPRRHVGISISFRFGEMKEQIKKAKRGISNDDSMPDGSQSSQGGAPQGG